MFKDQKREECLLLVVFTYGRFFVTSNASTAPTTAMAIIIPTIPGSKYVSAIDWIGTCVGAEVIAGSLA
jgi:hypothetical protein